MSNSVAYDGHLPTYPSDEKYWVANNATLVGRVCLGSGSSVWFGTTVRADDEPIVIGDGTNVQENCILHVDPGFPLHIGRMSSIGHGATLHGCTIGDGTVIGMGAIVLNGVTIGNGCLIAAGAVVKEGTDIPDGHLVVGAPAIIKRRLDTETSQKLAQVADSYRTKSAKLAGRVEP
tara:strand:- start:209 stop:736 length:528 start_codon:yes stop_codon:yes gene_type:complete